MNDLLRSFAEQIDSSIIKEHEMQAKKSNPMNRREVKNEKKAFSRTEKSVKPVAKDTNKTRRNMKKPIGRGK